MPIITLPDGKKLNFPREVTGLEIAEKISKSLAKQALIMSVDGELKDLYFEIDKDCSIKIFTAKDPEGLDAIRHDTTHIMAMAVQELFPGTKLAIGPAIKDGFYYDFYREEPFTPKDLDDYLKRIEEAEKRDHRKLGKEMDLFHFREESPGSVFWHEKGWLLFQRLIE